MKGGKKLFLKFPINTINLFLSDLRVAWAGLQEELGRRQSQSRAYYAIAQVSIHPSIYPCHCTGLTDLSLRTDHLFQDIESLSHELGVLRAKEDTGELELLEVICHVEL